MHLADDLRFIAQLCPVYLRPDLDIAIGIDTGSQFVAEHQFLVIRKNGRVMDGEIAFHHGLDFIDILSAFSTAARRSENNFF